MKGQTQNFLRSLLFHFGHVFFSSSFCHFFFFAQQKKLFGKENLKFSSQKAIRIKHLLIIHITISKDII